MRQGFISKRWFGQRWGSPVVGDAMALVAGLLMPFSFAPFGFYGLTIVALALLFQVQILATPLRAFWRGWMFGLAMFGVGVFWIHESFKFAAVALPLALLLTGGLIGFLALYPALFGFLAALWSRRVMPSGWPWRVLSHASLAMLLVLPAGWVLQEWLRGWLLGGFPWLQVGYAHVNSSLGGLAPLLGVYGVGWAVAMEAGLVLLIFRFGLEAWKGAGIKGSGIGMHIVGASVLLVLGVGIWGSGAWLDRVSWTMPVGAPVRIALVQGNVSQDKKWLASQRQPTLDRYLSLTRREMGRDLVVWPETALPGFYHEFTDFMAGLREEARARDTDVLLGAPTLEKESGAYFNSMVAITDTGELFYHKRHLVPFGEYLPMAGILRGILNFLRIPLSDFSAGPPSQAPLPVAGQKIGVSVCYEASFGRDIIASLPEATLLVNVSNDAWFGDSLGPHQNLQMARMRARESGRYLLRATNTGISALIDHQGRVMDRVPQFQVSVLTGTVTGMRGATPYVRYGDGMVVLLALVASVFSFIFRWSSLSVRS